MKTKTRKKKPLTLAQKLAFTGPIETKSSAARVIPATYRMGVQFNVR